MNRHLKDVGYQPENASVPGRAPNIRPPASPETLGPSPDDGGSSLPPSATSVHTEIVIRQSWWERILAPLAQGIVPAATLLVAAHLLSPVQTLPSPREVASLLYGLEVNRMYDETTARKRVKEVAPEAAALFEEWNDGTAKIEHGTPNDDRKPFYVPERRHDAAAEYWALAHRGFDRIKVYVKHVPPHWAQTDLDAHVYKWAKKCGVEPEWIVNGWSAFRPHHFASPVTECRPGGRCIVVSYGCRANAFDETAISTRR